MGAEGRGRGGGEGHSTGFFGPCQRHSRVKEKGRRRKPGQQEDNKSIKTSLFLCEDLCLEIKLDLELADRGLKCGAWTIHWDGKGTLSLRMGLKLG